MKCWLLTLRVRFHDGGASWCSDYTVSAKTGKEALEIAVEHFGATLNWSTKESYELILESIAEVPPEIVA